MDTPIIFREFDLERVERELRESEPALRAQLEALERAKRVTQKLLRMEVTI